MLAKRLPSILPDMHFSEALETTKIHSVTGLLKDNLVTERPFRSPHHTVSPAGFVGGGSVPNHALPSYAVAFGGNVNALEEKLRTGMQPIIGRIHEGKYLLDVRTLFVEDFLTIISALKEAGL